MNNPDLEGRPVFELTKARDPDSKVLGMYIKNFTIWTYLCYINL